MSSNEMLKNNNELYHFGVKGMKWGVRRYQNEDGSLTNLGKVRYGADDNGKMSKRGTKLYNKHRKQYLKNPDKVSFFEKRYQKAFDKLKNKGISDIEADKIAKGKVRGEKCMAAIGATAVATAVGIGIYHKIERGRDIVIKAGREMQTVHMGDAEERIQKGRAFYASFTKADNHIYSSRVFSHVTDDSKVTKFKSDENVKIASVNTSRKVFEDLMKYDADFRVSVGRDKHLGKVEGKKLFDEFQYQLVLRDKPYAERANKFYNALSARGYGGLVDNNDSIREGFTYKPVILFGKDKKTITSSKSVTTGKAADKQIKSASTLAGLRALLNLPAAQFTPDASLAIGLTAAINSTNAKNKFVKAYRKEHPNTKLSKAEIIKLYKSNKK